MDPRIRITHPTPYSLKQYEQEHKDEIEIPCSRCNGLGWNIRLSALGSQKYKKQSQQCPSCEGLGCQFLKIGPKPRAPV